MNTQTVLKIIINDLGDMSKEGSHDVTQKERGREQEGSWRHE